MRRTGVDLESMEVSDLLALSAGAVSELRRRGIVRTGNAPLGDFAEWLALQAFGGELAPNSERSFDLTTDDGLTVQVKARRVGDPPTAGQLQTSPFRTWGFDDALLLLVDEDTFEVRRASLVPASVVKEMSTYRKHVNGWTIQMSDGLMAHHDAMDVTDTMRSAMDKPRISIAADANPVPRRRTRPLRAEPELDPDTRRTPAPPAASAEMNWYWLTNDAIEQFKGWRINNGATRASASSYTAGAKRYARYCRSAGLDPHHATDQFHAHLVEKSELAPGSISDYRSHARAFVRFLDAIGR